MKGFVAFVRMEIRRIQPFFYAFMSFQFLVRLAQFYINYRLNQDYHWVHDLDSFGRNAANLLFRLDTKVYFMIPAVFAVTLIMDGKTTARYQRSLLPLGKITPIVAKICATLFLCAFIISFDNLLQFVSIHVTHYLYWGDTVFLYRSNMHLVGMKTQFALPYSQWLEIVLINRILNGVPVLFQRYMIFCLFYTALIYLAYSVMVVVKQWPVLTWGITFISGIVLLPSYLSASLLHISASYSLNTPIILLVSALYLFLGFFLYDKYYEV